MATGTLGAKDSTPLDRRMCRACRSRLGPEVRRPPRGPVVLTCTACGVVFERILRSSHSTDRPCCSQVCAGELVRIAAAARGGPRPVATRSARRRRRFAAAFVEPVERSVVFERDGWTCHLCGGAIDPALSGRHRWGATLDHLVPLSEGGRHEYANVKAAHLRCNSSRGARPLGRSA